MENRTEKWFQTIAAELKDEIFCRVDSKRLAAQLKEKGKNRAFWHERITPRAVADKLYEETGGDYSKIWHEHCYGYCGAELNGVTETPFYKVQNGDIYLCENCFRKIQSALREENKKL